MIFSLLSLTLFGQIERPVCDDVTEIPYTFSYSGFLIQEDINDAIYEIAESTDITLILNISVDEPLGETIYMEYFDLPVNTNGFFTIEIGKNNYPYFVDFIAYLNNNSNKEYYFDLFRRSPYKYLGSKKILTVPYAYVANSLNGMGPQGEIGPSGIQGPPGPAGIAPPASPPGDPGAPGECDFGSMPWRSSPPTQENWWDPEPSTIYIDDGTNTADGLPHVRYNLNGTWIDL